MSSLRFLGDHLNALLNHDLGSGLSLTPSVPKTPATSPQRRCYCNLPVEERQEVLKVKLNLREYKSEEIRVMTDTIKDAPYLIIVGKKQEENGVIPSEFIHRCPLPQRVNIKDFVVDISQSGALITVFKKIPADARKERVSPSHARYEVSQVTRTIILDY